jgi:hypothetical protein
MTRDTVKTEIIKAFGSYSEFCRLGDVNRYEFQKYVAAKKVMKHDTARYAAILATLKQKQPTLTKLPQKLESLKKAINALGGVQEFCRQNPVFKPARVYGALQGRTDGFKSITLKLLKHFGI